MLLNATTKAGLGAAAAPAHQAPAAGPACAVVSPLQLGEAEPEAVQKGLSRDENQALQKTQ